MESLSCKVCGAPLKADAVDRRLAIVTCHHCGSIFDLTKAGAKAAPAGGAEVAPRSDARERSPVPMPDRFQVERRGGVMKVKWRWFNPMHLFLLFFSIAWDTFLVVWYSLAMGDTPSPMNILFMVFPIAHVAVGIGMTYWAVAGLLNSTTVAIDESRDLKVSHFPLPWLPAPRIPAHDLEQLFVTKKIYEGKNGSSETFGLHAVRRDHSKVKLLGGLDQVEQALWLEQEIEGLLGIRDRAVAGEYLG